MSRTRIVLWGALAAGAALGVAGPGLASTPKNSISISGPTSVKIVKTFHLKVTGYIVSPANKVAVFTDSLPCKSHQLAELNRSTSREIDQFFPHVPGHFSSTESLYAGAVKTRYLCAYVFKRVAQVNDPHTTYAHTSHKWTQHH